MTLTKGQIDKAGESFSKNVFKDEVDLVSKEEIFDEFRRIHLEPTTEVMLKLQNWLSEFKAPYYIAQRIKVTVHGPYCIKSERHGKKRYGRGKSTKVSQKTG
jgi:hypothetical protein